MRPSRRDLIASFLSVAAANAACRRAAPPALPGELVDSVLQFGHVLRGAPLPRGNAPRPIDVLVVGAGAAGLSAAWRLRGAGLDDFVVCELDAEVGGTARAGKNEISAFPWGAHHHRMFHGVEKFFRPGYQANLTTAWLPALDGVVDKLKHGAKVADVGCGHGASSIVMAKAYPNSRFVRIDFHAPSVETARKRAGDAGLGARVSFTTATAHAYTERDFDLICFFDCLHDMGDPVGAVQHARQALKDDGTVLLVEPFAGNNLAENSTPVGRLYYAASTMVCTPNSLSQEVGLALGAQAGEARLARVFAEGGFTRFRRATETPFNLILEARK